MKQTTDFMDAMADFDIHPESVLKRAGSPREVTEVEGRIRLDIPFTPFHLSGSLVPMEDRKQEEVSLYLEAWTGGILRLTGTPGFPKSPMISAASDLAPEPLFLEENNEGWKISYKDGRAAARISRYREPVDGWSDLIRPSFDSLDGILFPETSAAAFSSRDNFFPEKVESLPLAFIETETGGEKKTAALFSFQARHDEHFCGTGERFSRMDLAGGTYTLENTDGLGNNSRRAYKNVPFFLSSRGYGLFIHSSAPMRLSLSDISTRAVQGRLEEGEIDLFFIDGPEPEKILLNYRRLTGFPPELPLWSYGTWMSRMTYFSAEEIEGITSRLRLEKYPCDIIHIDTGWFETDWVCEWKFSKERFPEPEAFMKRLSEEGFRVSLWQTPNIGEDNCLLNEAKAARYLAPPKEKNVATASDFSGQDFGGQIDFTYPEAVAWYRGKISRLLEMGAAVIKTDFGEKIQQDADYMNMEAEKLHNIYGLLYQQAAFEETEESTGEGIIWARAGWAGGQRYPLHWGGDTAASWDGMAAVLRGGLHLGLSGYGYWSHDVPGFHGLPEFMNSLPTDNLYIRWTQMGVFSSHLRYHGTSPREPWHYPEIAPLIRRWLNLRYFLIPYLVEEGRKISRTGMPLLRAMLLHHPEDKAVHHIDDQFFCGETFLTCPVFNDEGIRDIYLPGEQWIDFWTGEEYEGGQWLKNIESPLARLPLFCPAGAEIPVYPEPVQCTDEMDMNRVAFLKIDKNYRGFKDFISRTGLDPERFPG